MQLRKGEKTMKRILASVLALVMLLSYVPTGSVHVHATEEEEVQVQLEETADAAETPAEVTEPATEAQEETVAPTEEVTEPVTEPVEETTEPAQEVTVETIELSQEAMTSGTGSDLPVGLEYAVRMDSVTITGWSGTVTDLVIPSTIEGYPVQYLGDYAFANATNLVSVTLPETLRSISSSAFQNCTSLKLVNIPSSVTIIGNMVFAGCTSLQSVTIPDSVTDIGWELFNGCTSLTNVKLSNQLLRIPERVFQGCSALKTLVIPESVGRIANNAFGGNTGLESITLPFVGISNTETASSQNRFFGVIFSTSSDGGVATLQGNLTYYIPASLKTVTITGGPILSYAFVGCSNITSINLTGSVTKVGEYAFKDCAGLTSLVIGDSVTNIDKDVLFGCSNIQEVTIPFVGAYKNLNGRTKYTFGYLFGTNPFANAFPTGQDDPAGSPSWVNYFIPKSLTKVTVTGGILPTGAFRNCSKLTKVVLGTAITGAETNIFDSCTSLQEVTTPGGLRFVTDNMFNGCESLRSVEIADGVTKIGYNAFALCSGLKSVSMPNSLQSIDGYAFCKCYSLESIVIPESVTTLGTAVFYECNALQSVKLPSKLTELSHNLFYGCKKLNNVTIPSTVTSIQAGVFDYCASLESIVIPAGIITLQPIFAHCTSLKNVTLPDTVYEIASYTFNNCTSLETINLPPYLYKMGEAAFTGCSGLQSITLPENLIEIPQWAFNDCVNLRSVTFSKDTVKISSYAFAECTKLQAIYIPASVTVIGDKAFDPDMSPGRFVWHVFYGGTETQWKNIAYESTGMPGVTGATGDTGLQDATIHYNATGAQVTSSVNHCQENLTCNICNATLSNQLNYNHDCDGVEWTVMAPNGCTSGGTLELRCKICNGVAEVKSTDPLGHTGGTANCCNQAVCTRCGMPYGNTDPNNHSWDSGVITTQPTTETEGIRTYTCSGCKTTKTEVLPKVDHYHDYKSVVTAPTCTAQGYTTHTCSICGDSYQDSIVPAGHTGGKATCKDPAICDRCKMPYGSYDPNGHNLQLLFVTEPTCEQPGYTGEQGCTICGMMLPQKGDTIPALGHTGGTATCHYQATCDRCKMPYGDLNPNNHAGTTIGDTEIRNAKEGNCVTEGYTGDTYCLGCGNMISAGQVTGGYGHNYVTTVVEPTYTRPGYTDNVCSNCNDSFQTDPTDPLGLPKITAIDAFTEALTGKPALKWADVDEADYYEVYRSTSSGGKYTKVGTTEEDSYLDENAAAGKTWYYKVKAVCKADEELNSALSDSVSAKCTYPAPEVTIEYNSSGYPVLKWNKISGAKKYEVYYATEENGSYKKLTTTSSTSYTHSKTKMDVAYYYKVRAYGSSTSSTGEFSWIVLGYRVPPKPSITVTANNEAGTAKITWKKVTGAQEYELWCKVNDGEFEFIAGTTDTSYIHEGLEVGNTYIYRLAAYSKTVSSEYSAEKSIKIKCGKPVLTLYAEAETGYPMLEWEEVEGAATYEVQYATSSKGKYKQLTVTEDLYYVHEDAAAAKTYYYKVRAISGNEVAGDYCSVKSVVCDCPAPEIMEVGTNTSGYPVIKWGKVSGAKKYEVYYATEEDGSYKKLATTSSTSYTHSKAALNTEYYYKVRAYGSSTSSTGAFSETVFGVRKLAKPSLTLSVSQSGLQATLKWKKISGAVGYEIQYKVNDDEYETLDTVTGLSFLHEDLQPGNKYTYRVRALAENEAGSGDYGATKSGAIKCGKPVVTIELDEDGKPMLSWKEVEGATEYQIYRSTKKSSGYKKVDTVEDTVYFDSDAAKGKTYYYKVMAVSEFASGTYSSYVSIKSK